MCGIAGMIARASGAPGVDEAELVRIRDHMRARGPDGEGLWISPDRRVGLAHRRLSIIDLSLRGAQPMHSADGRHVITFNGEIYNYRALRAELEARGTWFRSTSDTEVLLHLFAARGEHMLRELRGMFAFAIWDAHERVLFLARDPYGIKPLYYADDGETFRFASQVKALLAGGRVSKTPSAAGQVGFYLFGSVPDPHTSYADIHALPAGSFLRVREGERALSPTQYFSIAECWRRALEKAQPEGEPVRERVRAALCDTVQHHLVADVPIAVFLSAGIDSGALAALVAETGATGSEAITLAFDEMADGPDDESELAALVAREYGFSHHRRVVTQREFEDDLPKILAAMDQPSIDGINTWFVSKATAEVGMKVAISGLGGDELFGGYPSFVKIPRWVNTMRPLAGVPALGRAARALLAPLLARQSRVSPKLAGLPEYGGSYAGAYLLKRGLFMPWELSQVLPADVICEGLEALRPVPYFDALLSPDPGTPFSRVATLESSHYMRNQLLRDTDWASMAHSLEARVPLVDCTLLDKLGAVLTRSQQPPGKRWLAEAPKHALPRRIVERAKTGFSTPIPVWIERTPSLGDFRAVRELNDPRCHWSRRWAYTVGRRHFGASQA